MRRLGPVRQAFWYAVSGIDPGLFAWNVVYTAQIFLPMVGMSFS